MSNVQSADEYIIYLTTNMVNGKIYVGQRKLQYNKKDDTYKGSGKLIRAALLKYGEENFKRVILQEAFSPEEADNIEIHYIKQLDSRNPKVGYNLHVGGNSQCGESNACHKRVRCIETGIIYKSIAHASKDTGTRDDSISSVCRGITGKAGGFRWEFVDEVSKKYENKPARVREVYCFNNDKTYSSVREAALELNLHAISITNVCKGKLNHTGNYTFKYTDGQSVTKQKVRVKCVNNGMEFDSIGEASRFMKVSNSIIQTQLKGGLSKNTELTFIKI